jgi:flagellar hook-associated protein FlgK
MHCKALLTDQATMSVASNNIANVNTPVYTREVANPTNSRPFNTATGNLERAIG